MKLAGLLLFTIACAEPVVEMQLVMPKNADGFDTSCLTAVEVRVNGATYPQVADDRRKSCIEVPGAASYSAIRDAIRGKFELSIPETGLSGIELYGWSGPAACKDDMDPFWSPDLLFFAGGDYIGQDTVDLPIVPNLGCTDSEVKVRQVDMFAMIGGATCAVATTVADGEGWAGVGTIIPKLFGKGNEFFGNQSWADTAGNVATFAGPTKIGPKTCLAIDASTMTGGATGCYIGGTPVCAGAGEYEHASLAGYVLGNATNYDNALMVTFPGVVIGSVWTAAKAPAVGAKVDVDPAHGKVVYVDAPTTGGQLKPRTDQSGTGPSGLFMLYTDTVVSAKVTAGSASRTVTLAATDELTAAAMIVVP